MRNPHKLEVTERFEYITGRHAEELYYSRLYWREIADQKGAIIQLVPIIDLRFKF